MEENKNVWKTGLNYGLITGLVLIIYSIILFITGTASTSGLLGLVTYLLLIAGITWAHHSYKTSGDGFMKYGEGLGIGAVVSGVAGLLSSIFSFIYLRFIDPDFMKNAVEEARIKMEDQGLSEDQIDQSMQFVEKMQSPAIQLFTGFFLTLLLGFIFSLIIAAITKKNDPAEEI